MRPWDQPLSRRLHGACAIASARAAARKFPPITLAGQDRGPQWQNSLIGSRLAAEPRAGRPYWEISLVSGGLIWSANASSPRLVCPPCNSGQSRSARALPGDVSIHAVVGAGVSGPLAAQSLIELPRNCSYEDGGSASNRHVRD